jgi:centromere-localized protein 2
MKTAVRDLQMEVVALESQTASVLRDLQTTVGDLSDLRYGKFPNGPNGDVTVTTEVIEGIKRVGVICAANGEAT